MVQVERASKQTVFASFIVWTRSVQPCSTIDPNARNQIGPLQGRTRKGRVGVTPPPVEPDILQKLYYLRKGD